MLLEGAPFYHLYYSVDYYLLVHCTTLVFQNPAVIPCEDRYERTPLKAFDLRRCEFVDVSLWVHSHRSSKGIWMTTGMSMEVSN